MSKNDAHFCFAIFDIVGYPGALIYSYIRHGCEKYPDYEDEYKWITVSIPSLSEKLHLNGKTATRSLTALQKQKLIAIKKSKGRPNFYRCLPIEKQGQNVPTSDGVSNSHQGHFVPTTRDKMSLLETESTDKMSLLPGTKCPYSENTAASHINTAMPENASLGTIGTEPQFIGRGGQVLGGAPPSNEIEFENTDKITQSSSVEILDLRPKLKMVPQTPEDKFLRSWIGIIHKNAPGSKLALLNLIEITEEAMAIIGGTNEDIFDIVSFVAHEGGSYLERIFFINPARMFEHNSDGIPYIQEANIKYRMMVRKKHKRQKWK